MREGMQPDGPFLVVTHRCTDCHLCVGALPCYPCLVPHTVDAFRFCTKKMMLYGEGVIGPDIRANETDNFGWGDCQPKCHYNIRMRALHVI